MKTNLISDLSESLTTLADAVGWFRATFSVSQGMSEDLPNAFGCSEAEAFTNLLDALGLGDLADDFRRTHDEGEEGDDCEHSWHDDQDEEPSPFKLVAVTEYDESDDADPGTPGPGALPHG